ncbi:MAG: hypothetical protein HGB26_02335 [Desulfobulbaceae bacterium]|nr:hypothetical protein [Desulfobulbaceae bacterium]
MLVLIWHLQPIRVSLGPLATETAKVGSSVLQWIYFKTLVAVPIFYFVSLILFFKKICTTSDCIRRIKRLVNIFIFWFVVQTIFYLFANPLVSYLNIFTKISANNSKLWWILIMGGRSLPLVGDAVFYFIFDLIILVFLSFLYKKISSNKADIIFFAILSLYFLCHQFFYAIPYWRIDNFLIYIPIAHYFANQQNSNLLSKKCFVISFCIYIFFLIYEPVMGKFVRVMHSAYDMNSLQWGVICLYIFVSINFFPKKLFIEWLSKYSLGIFAIHKFIQLIFLVIFSSMEFLNKQTFNTDGYVIQYKYIFTTLLTLPFCVLIIKLFCKNNRLKHYLS